MSAWGRSWPIALAAISCGLGGSACGQQLQVLDAPDAAAAELAASDCGVCPSGSFCRDAACVQLGAIETLAAGANHTCMVRRGQLLCWGANQQGQLGTGDTAMHPRPTRVGEDSDWFEVAAGARHSCGLRAPGRLFCWGDNSHGQIGDGGSGGQRNTPKPITSHDDFVAIAAGGDNSCAILRGGALFCWGDGSDGRTGVYKAGDQPITAPGVVAGQERFEAVAVGSAHSCAIRLGGALFCWGDNTEGQLGLGNDRALHVEPIQVGNELGWSQVALGREHSCGIRSRRLLCWGGNDYAQAGAREGPDGTRRLLDRPNALDSESDWSGVAAGGDHTCASKAVAGLLCWGAGDHGEVGSGSAANVFDAPARVPLQEAPHHLALGAAHSCVIDAQHRLFCWGDNGQGQLGLDDTTTQRDQPVQITL